VNPSWPEFPEAEEPYCVDEVIIGADEAYRVVFKTPVGESEAVE
jgi:hypothetical protein